MIRRFSLYGFLKNQQYYEPFLILVFIDRGLSFFIIGTLIAFREISVNVMEIPSGALADVFGRRKSMILSFTAYIASFIVFGLSRNIPLLFAAMFLFSIGEAFRTGTHKAMIFSWLRAQGREHERTKIYGYTRSWSKFGSAVSVLISAGIVLGSRSFDYIFFIAIVPYLLGIINFMGYPRELDGATGEKTSVSRAALHLKEALADCFRKPGLRRLMLESMGLEGIFKAASAYLQPILQAAAILWISRTALAPHTGPEAKTALLVGPVYFILYLLSAFASRRSHSVVAAAGGEQQAAKILWAAAFAVYLLLLPSLAAGIHTAAITGFILLYVIQNLWRPIQISRYDTLGSEHQGATILSIESQSKSLSTMIAAPLLGWAIDRVNTPGTPADTFWPVALLGAAVSLAFLITATRGKSN